MMILPSIKDRRLKRGWTSEILRFDQRKTVIARVYGESLEELRERKQAVVAALRQLEKPNSHKTDSQEGPTET